MTRSMESFLLALGGFIGFACAFLAALKGGAGVDSALMKASIAMLLTALLVKIFLYVTRSSLRNDSSGERPLQGREPGGSNNPTAETH